MAEDERLLSMRSGSSGEDWLEVLRCQTVHGEQVSVTTEGGLSRTEMMLDRESAEALRDALTQFLAA